MKLKCAFAMLLTVVVVMSAGCTNRNNNNNTTTSVPPVVNSPGTVPNSVPDVVPDIDNGVDDFRSGIEEGVSDYIIEELEPGEDELDETSPDEDQYRSEPFDESVAATMSTDFEQIGALDAEKRSWGPGLDVDADKRPLGSTDYQQKYGKYGAYFIAPNTNKVYLTFDEGYENGQTASILDTLKEKNVKAVFFITYPYAQTEQDLVRRMVSEGHILGNHSTKHLSFPDMPMEEAAKDIIKLHEYVKATYGYTMTLFRPPMGEFSERTLAITDSLGYSSVFWSFAYKDWEVDNQPLTIEALDTVTKRCHPGAIFLLHAVSQTNAEILGDAIDNIRAQGYEFARFDWA